MNQYTHFSAQIPYQVGPAHVENLAFWKAQPISAEPPFQLGSADGFKTRIVGSAHVCR